MKGAIVIPAGSGKTTLSKKYKELYDIDSFHTEQDIKNLNKLYKEVSLTNNWEKYNLYEISLIEDKINSLPTPYIVLLHCKEKAELLKLTYLGACKISKKIMGKIASDRGKTDKLREQQTRNNWKYSQAAIFESHETLEKYILDLCKDYNIILNY